MRPGRRRRHTAYLGHELVGYSLVVLKADLASSQRALQEESKRQLSQLSLDQRTDGLVGEGEDLLALLFPLVILTGDRVGQLKQGRTKRSTRGREEGRLHTDEEFSLYLKASW